MSDDLDDVLNDREPATPETPEPAEPEVETTTETEPEAAEAAPAEEAEKPAEPEKSETPMVPASVVAELRREIRELKQPQKEPEKPAPDVIEDQSGFVAHMQKTVDQRVKNERLNTSEMLARDKFGDKVVDTAFEALRAANDQAAYQAMMAARSPYHELVKWHQRQEVAREVGDDPAAWRQAERERIRKELQAEMATKQIKDTASEPAPSLANVTGAGGQQSPGWAGPVDLEQLLS